MLMNMDMDLRSYSILHTLRITPLALRPLRIALSALFWRYVISTVDDILIPNKTRGCSRLGKGRPEIVPDGS